MDGIHHLLSSVLGRLAKVGQSKPDSLVEECEFTETVCEGLVLIEGRNRKNLGIGMESYDCPGVV